MSSRELSRKWWLWAGCTLVLPALLAVATLLNLTPSLPASLETTVQDQAVSIFEDRNGLPLNRTYQTRLNVYDRVAFHDIPERMIDAFIMAEDARFFSHQGIDWLARVHAIWQNIKSFRAVRGASTITEQVVRILHPRPRTYWSRWLEGWDAIRLEHRFSKQDILEFYLNQVPFSAGRRGVVQASRYYFGRSLDTLNTKEILALATMVRAPSLLDPYKKNNELDKRVLVLAERMLLEKHITSQNFEDVISHSLTLHKPGLTVEAPHFLAFVREQLSGRSEDSARIIRTTLDAELQQSVIALLEQRLKDVADYGIHNGGVLVVDHTSGDVLAWTVAGKIGGQEAAGGEYDAVRTARQPGSTLKPFVYALALDKGWNAETPVKDEPVFESVQDGLHVYRNFSKIYYGMVSMAEALGNSLNTPAIRALDFVGLETFISKLRDLGLVSLSKGAEVYGNGIVLGNAEISLLELVQAYSCLARGGKPLTVKVLIGQDFNEKTPQHLFSEKAAKTISMILSEELFRRLEFGRQSILSFPERTAVKTGTSAEGKDVWTVAYNGRFLVGIWFGNMDRSSPTKMITGAVGPALLARSIFGEIRKRYGANPLPREGMDIKDRDRLPPSAIGVIKLVVPTAGMEVLFDGRISTSSQYIPFYISGLTASDRVEWLVDGKISNGSTAEKLLWPVTLGTHSVSVTIARGNGEIVHLSDRKFVVK